MAAIGSVAWAVIPDSSGVIHGCRSNKSGALRVIDAPSQSCKTGETPLNWNQQGSPGIVQDASCPASQFVTGVLSGQLICAALPQIRETAFDVDVTCTSTGQLCSPAFTTSVDTLGVLKAEFTASVLACSDARYLFYVDGVLQQTSGFIGALESTGLIDLGPVSAGAHDISVQAEGRPGGCNTSGVSAWLGVLTVTASV